MTQVRLPVPRFRSGDGRPEPPGLVRSLQAELGSELQIVRRLGGGALSSVYLAREPALQRLVAVKVLHPVVAGHPKNLARFRREAHALARVFHPNVVSIFRVGDLSSATPFLVMQYVKGRNLEERLQSDGPLEPKAAAAALAALSAALSAVHSHGIVHRDVRPESVLCEDGSGRILLADFGLAAFHSAGEGLPDSITTAGRLVIAPRYASPEHLQGADLTGASDVYALGILAYHMLTDRGPYEGVEAGGHARAHLIQDPLPLASLGASIPPGMESLVIRCLAKRPGDRPSAAEVARCFDSFTGFARTRAEGGADRTAAPALSHPPMDPIPEGHPRPRLVLRMLGGIDLQSTDGTSPKSILRQPKRLALLSFLAAGPEEAFHQRDTLIGLFWPDVGTESGRHSLRQALYVLRRELGSDLIRTRGDAEVGLNAGAISSDVGRFDALSGSGREAAALALYRGDLLPGFYLDDAPEFEHWLASERVRLRRRAAQIAWRASENAAAEERSADAARWARTAVDLDPFDEAALHRLIELLDSLGDRAGALAAFDHFARRLADEYAAEPSPETQRLVKRVRERG